MGDCTWPCICTSLGTWWKMRRCLLTEAGGEESAEGGTSLNKVFQGLGAKCSEGQWFAVGQRPWGLPGRRGRALQPGDMPLAGRGQPQPGHLAPSCGWGMAKAGLGCCPTGQVRGAGVRHRLSLGWVGTAPGQGWAGSPACKLGPGSSSARPTAGPVTWHWGCVTSCVTSCDMAPETESQWGLS